MYLFDTDHITALDRGGEEGERLRTRLAHVPPEEAAVSVVSYEEQMRGWLAYIAQLRAEVLRNRHQVQVSNHLKLL